LANGERIKCGTCGAVTQTKSTGIEIVKPVEESLCPACIKRASTRPKK